jgi:hypothetical protein
MPEYDPENPPMLGFFMVGAYQEILGNMHNLFGDTEAVDVFVFPDGSVEVELSDEGDTVADMLEYVQLDPKTLLTQFRDQVKNTGLDDALQQQFLEEFEAGLYGFIWKTSSLMPGGAALTGSGRPDKAKRHPAECYTHLNPYALPAIIRPNKRFTNQSLPRRV